jgi:hypothetical protein
VSIDPAPLGVLTTELMDMLEDEYIDRPVEIRAAIVVVDVGVPDEDGDHWTHVRWKFSSAPDWDTDRSSSAYAAGLCVEALKGLTEGETR